MLPREEAKGAIFGAGRRKSGRRKSRVVRLGSLYLIPLFGKGGRFGTGLLLLKRFSEL